MQSYTSRIQCLILAGSFIYDIFYDTMGKRASRANPQFSSSKSKVRIFEMRHRHTVYGVYQALLSQLLPQDAYALIKRSATNQVRLFSGFDLTH